MLNIHDIRKKYLDFFAARGHKIVASASLVPENDPTTLFTGSGMQPMVPYLLGEPYPDGKRIADSQKCFRSQDIDEVGDNRHTTFFEMMGNWSLGDYFKQEQISWIFEFLTQEIGLDPKNLYVTVFRGNDVISRDEESAGIWKEVFAKAGIQAKDVDFSERDGMQDGRIFYYDEKKNWWSRSGVSSNMPAGEPGGPDSEMFWDFGAQLGFHERWMAEVPERFHHVRENRKMTPCHVNCDCGRFMEIGNNVFMEYKKTESGFDQLPQKNVDFGGGLERISAAANGDFDVFNLSAFTSARAILESFSSVKYGTDAISTRSMRVILDHLRAATFLIGDGVLPSNKDQGYFVRRLIRRAIRFGKDLGINQAFCEKVVASYIAEYQASYSSLVEERELIMAEIKKEEEKFARSLDRGLKEFEKLVRIGTVEQVPFGGRFPIFNRVDAKKAFYIYQTFGFPLEMIQEELAKRALLVDPIEFQKEVEIEKKKHQDLSRTGSEQKFTGGLADTSAQSVRYHTATHLLHQALRTVLGNHVLQKGSNITPERLRFDFSHGQKMTQEELSRVEQLVNERIQESLPVHFEVLDIDEAKKRGAIGIFEDKYAALGNQVKVYFVGHEDTGEYFSAEVCGGPHVTNTKELGHFRIIKEEAVASGIRRIKGILE